MKLSVALSFVLLSVISLSAAVVYPTCTCEKPPVCDGKVKGQWDQRNIQNYLRATMPAQQTVLTFCFYYGPNAEGALPAATDPTKQAWILSAATQQDHNTWIVGIVNGKLGMHRESPENLITENLEAFTEPHRHCFVWKRNEYLKWFYDKTSPGELELVAEVGDSGNNSLPAGTSITILNEQDTPGGGLDTAQMMPGLVADFQIWDSAASNAEMLRTECGEKGNLISFDEFEIVGTQEMEECSAFECRRT